MELFQKENNFYNTKLNKINNINIFYKKLYIIHSLMNISTTHSHSVSVFSKFYIPSPKYFDNYLIVIQLILEAKLYNSVLQRDYYK